MSRVFFLIGVILFFSCKNKINIDKQLTVETKDTLVYVESDIFQKFQKIDFSDSITDLYVVNPYGAKRFLHADINTQLPGKIPFDNFHNNAPHTLYKIKNDSDWYVTNDVVRLDTIVDHVTYNYSTNDVWVFVKLADFEKKNDIKLKENELNLLSYFSDVSKGTNEYKIMKSDLIEFEIISKKIFESYKSNSNYFFIPDSTKYKRENNVLKLPFGGKNEFIELKDQAGEGGSTYKYFYHGNFSIFNSYLVGFLGYEEYTYFLYDKDTGKLNEDVNFIDFPYVSPDKKQIICVHPNPYEMTADIQISFINNGKIETKYFLSFLTWMPIGYETKIYWVDNKSFVVETNHTFNYWTDNGEINTKGEYIKVTLKNL